MLQKILILRPKYELYITADRYNFLYTAKLVFFSLSPPNEIGALFPSRRHFPREFCASFRLGIRTDPIKTVTIRVNQTQRDPPDGGKLN